MKNKRTTEELNHFQCWKCKKWWAIGDAPKAKKKWFCPWCGALDGEMKKSLKNKSKK